MTLIEVMVVVFIMAILATAVAAAVIPQIEKARIEQTTMDCRTVRAVAQQWIAENRGCPRFEELALDRAQRRTDAWDHPFAVECEPDGAIVSSRGPDGEPDTPDDIRVPKREAPR
jgi:prepilin-type N-terminal cleavage/methylation domain-containing protein